jgi:glutathione peroxidase
LQNTNYPALRTLYDKYKGDGFNLVAFPCNQFGGQAPGSSEEERAWAFRKFGFEFDVFVSALGALGRLGR